MSGLVANGRAVEHSAARGSPEKDESGGAIASRRHARASPPPAPGASSGAKGRDPRERSGTVVLYATLASGNEKLLKREPSPTKPSSASSSGGHADGYAKARNSSRESRKKGNRSEGRVQRMSRDDSDAQLRPKRSEMEANGTPDGRGRAGSLSAEDGGWKRRGSEVAAVNDKPRPIEAEDRRRRPSADLRKEASDRRESTSSSASVATQTPEKREDRRKEERGSSPSASSDKARAERPRDLSSSGGVPTSHRTHHRRRSWSKDDEEKKKSKQSGHRRSKSRTEGKVENDRLEEAIAEDMKRLRRGSDPIRIAQPTADKSRSRRPSAAQEQSSESHSGSSVRGSSAPTASGRSVQTRVVPLNLKLRERAPSASAEPEANENGGDPSKDRKTILDKVAALLSPGRRQRDDDQLIHPSAAANRKGTEAAKEQAEDKGHHPQESSESSLASTKMKSERRRDSEASEERVPAHQEKFSGSVIGKASQPDEESGKVSTVRSEKNRSDEKELESEQDDPNAPKRRSVLALRKRFSTVSHPHPADEARSKRFKQLSNVGHKAPEISAVLAKDGFGELGSRRSGRSSSSPNVSNIPRELRVWWEDFSKDDQDLDMLYGDGVSLVSGVGVGGAGMGTLLVRADNSEPVDPDSNSNPGISLPRRVLRSSSQNSRISSVMEASFLRRKTPIMLEELLSNRSMRVIFYHHVEKSLCAENVEFYDAVQNFKAFFHEDGTYEEEMMTTIKQTAEQIYTQYVAPEAPKQVNIDIGMSRNLKARLESPTRDMFHDVERSIRELIHCSILPKFYQSTEFRTVAELEEVKLALAVENEKLRRLLDKLSEQRGRIGLLEQKQAMLTQYFNNFEQSAAEFLKQRQEKNKDASSGGHDMPASKISAIIGKVTASSTSSAKPEQEKTGIKRWALWPDQKAEAHQQNEYIICIEVIEAQDLIAKRGFCNPYVVVKYGRQKYTTRTVFKNLNPRWREHFIFNVKHDESAKLWVTVWDYNMLGSGEFLGCVSFASPRLFINSSDRWWTLEARKEGEAVSGKIRLQMHYRKHMDREEELNYELQKVRNAIREETSSLQKTAMGLWGGRSADSKDDIGREKLLKTLKERRQKLEKEASERETSSSLSSSGSVSLLECSGGGIRVRTSSSSES